MAQPPLALTLLSLPPTAAHAAPLRLPVSPRLAAATTWAENIARAASPTNGIDSWRHEARCPASVLPPRHRRQRDRRSRRRLGIRPARHRVHRRCPRAAPREIRPRRLRARPLPRGRPRALRRGACVAASALRDARPPAPRLGGGHPPRRTPPRRQCAAGRHQRRPLRHPPRDANRLPDHLPPPHLPPTGLTLIPAGSQEF